LEAHVAVIGPMRMNYVRTASAVLHVGQAFKSATV
jgi:transcriptional regulator of heat shock response